MAKAKQRFAWKYDAEAKLAEVTDKVKETTVAFAGGDLPETIAGEVFVYGIGKVLQDRESGTDADAKLEGYASVWERLVAGNWKAERVAGFRTVSPAVELVGKLKKVSTAAAQKAYSAQDDAWKAAFAEKYADEIAAIKQDRETAPEVSLDDLVS